MLKDIINKLDNPDFKHKVITIGKTNINIIFIETLIDTVNLNRFILEYFDVIKLKKKNIFKYIMDIPNSRVFQLLNNKSIILPCIYKVL